MPTETILDVLRRTIRTHTKGERRRLLKLAVNVEIQSVSLDLFLAGRGLRADAIQRLAEHFNLALQPAQTRQPARKPAQEEE